MKFLHTLAWISFLVGATACIPSGSSASSDAGPAVRTNPSALSSMYEDTFERATLGTDWISTAGADVWRIEEGRLCAQGGRNRGIWLNRILPVNARIEYDAVSYSPDGDLKAEFWGDGRSAATAISYSNATSYLVIFGGWKNSLHAIARLNEHGSDRKEISIDSKSDDPRQRAVNAGQLYRFRVERNDGKTIRWSVDETEMLSLRDASPLVGEGHDHFGFNNWGGKVCFDNVRVTPL